MSSISSGQLSHVATVSKLMIRNSPLAMFIIIVINSPNPKVQWLGDALLFRAPVVILAGCRLILSIREENLQSDPSDSNFADSTVVFGDRSNLSRA